MCALKIDYGIDYFGGKRFQYRRIFVGFVISRFTTKKDHINMVQHGGARIKRYPPQGRCSSWLFALVHHSALFDLEVQI